MNMAMAGTSVRMVGTSVCASAGTNLNVAMADVMVDATVAQRAKQRPELAADMQALCWGSLGAREPNPDPNPDPDPNSNPNPNPNCRAASLALASLALASLALAAADPACDRHDSSWPSPMKRRRG